MKQLVLTLCLVLASGSVQAQSVYEIVRPDGTVEFTDAPPPGAPAKKIEVPPLNTTEPLAPPFDASTQPAASAPKRYSEVRITRPGNDEAIRDNAGNVNVDLSLNPSLRAGDKIDLYLDGQTIDGDKATATAITLADIQRGTHSIQALIKNSAGTVVARSNSVTFTLQRRSAILQPSPPKPELF